MKRILRSSSALLILLIICIPMVFCVPSPTEKFYVNDLADVIDDDTENYLMSNSRILDEKTGAQIVVLTVNSLDGMDLSQFSLNVLREWGIGNKDKNNGLLILLSTGERKIKIEIGYGLEGAINDGKAGRILDTYAIPHFKNDDFGSGIKEAYSAVLSEIYSEYGMEVPDDVSSSFSEDSLYTDNRDKIYSITLGIILLILFFSLFIRRDKDNNHMPPFIGGGFYGGFGGGRSGGGFGGFGGGGGSGGGGGASRGF